MKVLSTIWGKILLLIFISGLVFIFWQNGLETAYQKVLVGVANFSMIKSDTHIELEKNPISDKSNFRVFTKIDTRKGNYPQEIGSMLQPFVIILSWQIFLFFVISKKSALQSFWINSLIFLFIQVLFLLMLTSYYTSDLQKYIFTMMMDSFYIIALILIIKDNIVYSVFKK